MEVADLAERIRSSTPPAFEAILRQYRQACERGTPREALRLLGQPKIDYTDDLPALSADLDRAAMLHSGGELEEAWGLLLRAGEMIAYSLGRLDMPFEGSRRQLASQLAAERAPRSAIPRNERRDAEHQRVVDALLSEPASQKQWKNQGHLDRALEEAFAKKLPDSDFTEARLRHLRAHPDVAKIREGLPPLRRRRNSPNEFR